MINFNIDTSTFRLAEEKVINRVFCFSDRILVYWLAEIEEVMI